MRQKEKRVNKTQKRVISIGFLILYAFLAVVTAAIVSYNGQNPAGHDTLYHLYRGEFLYEEMCKGNWIPLYDGNWYNGVELLRYWAPLSPYLVAGCIALAGGSTLGGYLVYVAVVLFFGAVNWLIVGAKVKRLVLGGWIGALWFFIPNNLYTLFGEGNLARSLCMTFMPWLLYMMYAYDHEKKARYLLGVAVSFAFISMCHLGYACMIFGVSILFFIWDYFFGGKIRKKIHLFIAMLLGIGMMGFWILPSVMGGMFSMDNSQTMLSYFQNLSLTLNPLRRLQDMDYFYFGIASLIIIVIALLGGKRKEKQYFITPLCILGLTSVVAAPVLASFPLGQYFWMVLVIPVAICMILFGLLLWDTGKKWLIVCLMLLQVADAIPSLSYIYGDFSGQTMETRYADFAEESLMTRAKEITKQRIALMDDSVLESQGAYILSSFQGKTATTYGYGWTSAETASNIMQMNEAMEGGAYVYLFNCALNLGNDSVLVYVPVLQHKDLDIGLLDEAAKTVGYELDSYNESYRLYHMDTPDTFGVVRHYKAAGIGKGSSLFAMRYPCIEELDSENINDYTYEELSQYELIYLDQFTYTEKHTAENLLKQLADEGTRIVISATGIPTEETTGIQSFLGVNCQTIQLDNGYPLLYTKDGIWDTDLFADGYSDWKTVYVQGLDEVTGYFTEMDKEFAFMGTVYNSNICMIGLGLPYHYSLTKDRSVETLLDQLFSLDSQEIAEAELVPISVTYEGNDIVITCPRDQVNTTLAYHSIFSSTGNLYEKQNLLYVNQGTTEITMTYPFYYVGIGVSIGCAFLMIVFMTWVRGFWNRRDIEEIDVFGIIRPEEGCKPAFTYSIPERVKYNAVSLKWLDEEGNPLSEEDVYEDGTYTASIEIEAHEDELFSKAVKANVNNYNADVVQWIDSGHVHLEMKYKAFIPFKFLQQPEDISVAQAQTATVTWRISQTPKVGYLQLKEDDNWIIQEVLPVEVDKELSITIEEELTTSKVYRLVYIVGNGRTHTSREFTVHFTRQEKSPIFFMAGDDISSSFRGPDDVI